MKFNNISNVILRLYSTFVCINIGYTMESYLNTSDVQDIHQKIQNFFTDGISNCPVYTTKLVGNSELKRSNFVYSKFFAEAANSAFRQYVNINKFYKDKASLMRHPDFLSGLFRNEYNEILIPRRSSDCFREVWRWITRCSVVVSHGTRFTSCFLIPDIFQSVLQNIKDRYCVFSDKEFCFIRDEIKETLDIGNELCYLNSEKLSERFFKVDKMSNFLINFKKIVKEYYPFPTKCLPDLNPERIEYYKVLKPENMKSVYDWTMYGNIDKLLEKEQVCLEYSELFGYSELSVSYSKIDILKKYKKARKNLVSLAQLCINDLVKVLGKRYSS